MGASSGSSGAAAASSPIDLYNAGYAAAQAGKYSDAVTFLQKAIGFPRKNADELLEKIDEFVNQKS